LCSTKHHGELRGLDNLHRTGRSGRQEAAGKMAKSTGRSRSFLAVEAINEYLDINEWQVAGVKRAIASLDRGAGVPHARVKEWVASWGSGSERPIPRRS
jgi:RHH-type rel operon transcriptional repressor/antitoxin RelB